MSFAYVAKHVSNLQVNDLLLGFVSADGHGYNFVRLLGALTSGVPVNTSSAKLPTVTSITHVGVDDPAGDGNNTGANASGPYHVFLTWAATDQTDAPSVFAPWLDQNCMVITATG